MGFHHPFHAKYGESNGAQLYGANAVAEAAANDVPTKHSSLQNPRIGRLKKLLLTTFFTVFDVLKRPGYAIPFLLNITGSMWFFLLIGKAGMLTSDDMFVNGSYTPQTNHICLAELSLTVPIVNSLAFLFTVIGEWYVDGRVIARGKLELVSDSTGDWSLC